jgi:hypothetical protein
MNRHQKRAQNASIKKMPAAAQQTLGALEEFSQVVENLKPYLVAIKHMAQRIDDTVSVLKDVELRNASLKAELALQREVTLRLVYSMKSFQVINMENVRLLESQIQDEILKEAQNGQTTEPAEPSPEEDPGPGAQV